MTKSTPCCLVSARRTWVTVLSPILAPSSATFVSYAFSSAARFSPLEGEGSAFGSGCFGSLADASASASPQAHASASTQNRDMEPSELMCKRALFPANVVPHLAQHRHRVERGRDVPRVEPDDARFARRFPELDRGLRRHDFVVLR